MTNSTSQTVALSTLDRFLDAAYDLFNLNSEEGRGKNNPHYLAMPVRLGEGALPSEDDAPETIHEYVNPLIFLTGIETSKTTPSANQQLAQPPSVSLIVGQYGLGKTELVFQLCHHMECSVERALPINLGLCRSQARLLDDEPSAENFSNVIFGRVLERAGLGQSTLAELLPEIRRGNILLILDGLDELISTQKQHNHFFAGLIRLLAGGEEDYDDLLFKVAVSMRFEYLSGVANKDASDLAALIEQESPVCPSVYFLVLDYLGDSSVDAYLSFRLPNVVNAFDELRQHNRLLEMLRRPLLLRIFSDLAALPNIDLSYLLSALKKNENPANLLQTFVAKASEDENLNKDQDNLTSFTWDAKKLAHKSLDLYRNGRSEMTIDDIRDFIKPVAEGAPPVDSLSPQEVLKAIHKCPFLRQDAVNVSSDSKNVARFAHRIFFEYFTAEAMSTELKNASEDATQKNKRAFDELVLNVDMRKFLRGLVIEKVWYSETRKSYGLDNKGEWENRESIPFEFLDKQRSILLDSMTDPESPPDQIHETVKWFLERQKEWLHPRYLIYNYEAVAVYLWYHRWKAEARSLGKEFDEILRGRLEAITAELSAGDTKLRKAKELLLERILDIGRRLRYTWAKDFADKRRDQLSTLISPEDKDITRRIDRILEDIRSAVF